MKTRLAIGFCFFVLSITITRVSSFPLCSELPYNNDSAIEVNASDDLNQIISMATQGQVFLLNSGTYKITSIINITTPNIIIRSKSGKRNDVILNGNKGGADLQRENFVTEILSVKASGVKIAHLSIRYASDHGVHISPTWEGKSLKNILLHDIRVSDCGQQLIKVNSNGNENNLQWVDSSALECSLLDFENNSVMQDLGSMFYTGGLDAHGASYWGVRYNTFKNINRESRLMEHAVHFWSKSRENLVENNIFINVYRGIGFGLKTEAGSLERKYSDEQGDSPYFDHLGGNIRNNVIYNSEDVHLESGIELNNVKNVHVSHNTVLSDSEPFSSIEYRWENSSVIIKNNVVSHQIKQRNNASGELAGNFENSPLTYFVDVSQSNFHLSSQGQSSLGNGVPLGPELFGIDMDGEIPDAIIYAGADQFNGVSALSEIRKQSNFTLPKPHFSGRFMSIRVKGELYNIKGGLSDFQ